MSANLPVQPISEPKTEGEILLELVMGSLNKKNEPIQENNIPIMKKVIESVLEIVSEEPNEYNSFLNDINNKGNIPLIVDQIICASYENINLLSSFEASEICKLNTESLSWKVVTKVFQALSLLKDYNDGLSINNVTRMALEKLLSKSDFDELQRSVSLTYTAMRKLLTAYNEASSCSTTLYNVIKTVKATAYGES